MIVCSRELSPFCFEFGPSSLEHGKVNFKFFVCTGDWTWSILLFRGVLALGSNAQRGDDFRIHSCISWLLRHLFLYSFHFMEFRLMSVLIFSSSCRNVWNTKTKSRKTIEKKKIRSCTGICCTLTRLSRRSGWTRLFIIIVSLRLFGSLLGSWGVDLPVNRMNISEEPVARDEIRHPIAGLSNTYRWLWRNPVVNGTGKKVFGSWVIWIYLSQCSCWDGYLWSYVDLLFFIFCWSWRSLTWTCMSDTSRFWTFRFLIFSS